MTAPAGNAITTTEGSLYPFLTSAALPKPNTWMTQNSPNNDVTVTVTLGNDFVAVDGVQVYLCVDYGGQFASFLVCDGAVHVALGFTFTAHNNQVVPIAMQYVAQTGLPVAQTEGPITTKSYTPAVPAADNTGNSPVLPAPTCTITAANP
jgi:hypothetical protein